MNYYAVTAELARVYLYAGMPDEAYKQAEIIIQQNSLFAALTDERTALEALREGNVKCMMILYLLFILLKIW